MTLKRIAMWSGPRNISTAMMRAWENRSDTFVVDEPLYGSYLHRTKKKHPLYQEIIEHQGIDHNSIIHALTHQPASNNEKIFYQKHMSHHILEGDDLNWTCSLDNIFLIREPSAVLASYVKKHNKVTAYDLGFPQQLKLFQYLQVQTKQTPLVIDASEVLKKPRTVLSQLCQKLNIPFDENMLHWPKGYRESDGIWAQHWYNKVIDSTSFIPYRPRKIILDKDQTEIAKQCLPYYETLHQYALK